MKIKQEDPIKISPLVYEIVKHSFTREYDYVPKNTEEVVDYIKDSDVFVVYKNNDPAGYFVLKNLSNKSKELKSMAVHEKYQGEGIGKVMMNEILKKSKKSSIKLVTHPKNTGAILLYLKNGFDIIGWIENWEDGEPRLKLLRKTH